MSDLFYLMESAEEIERLEMKTRGEDVIEQALWAGICPGQRVADIGCGSGKTSFHLLELVQPGGEVVGIDASCERVQYARRTYEVPNLSFVCRDCLQPLTDLGGFDFIWIRFLLEYYDQESFSIVKNAYQSLKPGGILCLIDLDHNGLNHFELPPVLARSMKGLVDGIIRKTNFDPYVGRKLYSYLYDLKLKDIKVDIRFDRLIYGPLKEEDWCNWRQKMLAAVRHSGYDLKNDYPDGEEEFFEEFKRYLFDPRRFIYTPMIICRGRKLH